MKKIIKLLSFILTIWQTICILVDINKSCKMLVFKKGEYYE